MALPPLVCVASDARDEFDGDQGAVRDVLVELAGSARRAGRKAVVSGRWLADTVVELAPRIPVRDAGALSAHHGGLTGAGLAKATTKAAGRVSAGMGAATGTLVTAQQLSVATVLLVPFELAALTALVTGTELKLIAELHQVAGRPLGDGRIDASRAALLVWASGHALSPSAARPSAAEAPSDDDGGQDEGTRGLTLSRAARRELMGGLRKRYARNLSALAPMLTGAAAAGVLNRQATVGIGRDVCRDLGLWR